MPGEIVELSPKGVRRVDVVFRPRSYSQLRTLTLKEEKANTSSTAGDDSCDTNGQMVTAQRINGAEAFLNDIEDVPPAFCIFEYVYFARADSYFEGKMFSD